MRKFSNPLARVVTRTAAILAILIMAFLVLPSCARDPIPNDTAVVLIDQEPLSLDPLKAGDATAQKIINLVHGALVSIGPDFGVVPELAESWKIEGYCRFSFVLRKNLNFQDGSALTAADVVRSIEESKAHAIGAVAFSHIAKVKAASSLSVVIETDIPQPFLLDDLPMIKVFKKSGNRWIGSGRFKLVEQRIGEIELERFAGFPEPASTRRLRKIIFRYVRDEMTRYQALLRGDGNAAINGFNVTKTAHFRASPVAGFQIIDSPGVNVAYLCFNFRDRLLANLKVRRAIAHAIDVQSILKYRFGVMGTQATGLLSPLHSRYYEPAVRRFEFDQAAAERLLDEAGYPRKGTGGWRFSLTYKTTFDKTGYDTALILADMLRRVGIDVRLQITELATFFADVRAGNFQIFSSRWIGVVNPSIYFRVFHSSQTSDQPAIVRADGGLNRGAYANRAMDKLLEAGMIEPSDLKRRSIFLKVQKLAADDLPYVNLWYWNNTFIGSAAMKNIVMYPNGNFLTLNTIEVDAK